MKALLILLFCATSAVAATTWTASTNWVGANFASLTNENTYADSNNFATGKLLINNVPVTIPTPVTGVTGTYYLLGYDPGTFSTNVAAYVFVTGLLKMVIPYSPHPPSSGGFLNTAEEQALTDAEGNYIQIEL